MSAVSPTSGEFYRLEYLAKISLRSTTLRVTDAFLISNPTHSLSFERRTKSLKVIESWIESDSLTGISNEEDICKKLSNSIKLSTKGVTVRSKLKLTDNDSGLVKKICKRFVFCKVGIGKSLVQSQLAENPDCKYDSVVSFDGKDIAYLIQDPDQILPIYVATIEYDPVEERKSRDRPVCDNCENSPAAVYCTADSANLCNSCDENIHSSSKLMSKHVRSPLGKGPDSFGNCRYHNEKIGYFCYICQIPVCLHCKMIGNHSIGESSKHKLIRATEAFDSVIKETSRRDPSIYHKLEKLSKQEKLIEDRGKEIERMQISLMNELSAKFETLKQSLNCAISFKKFLLLAEKVEVIRQKEQIEDAESFLRYQQTSSDMSHLLFTWSTHQSVRQALKEMPIKEDIDIFPDLRIEGTLSIEQDPIKTKNMSGVLANTFNGKNIPFQGKRPSSTITKDTGVLFAETLNMLDTLSFERASTNNKIDTEESIACVPSFDKLAL